ncbi:MAG: hypothetical protein Q4C55_00500 [Eubacterium sp.]|nr:hypothetical protein [Eubacterium sp.]
MNNNYRIKKRIGAFESALLGNVLYILGALIFKVALDIIGTAGGYNLIFGAVEFGVMSLFWVIFNWLMFRNVADGKKGGYGRYIFYACLPIILFTAGSLVVMYAFPGQGFSATWNQFSFVVAPTLFWYLPFGLIYHFIGSYLPVAAFFGISLVWVILLQSVGIALGAKRRAKMHEREEKRIAYMERQAKITAEKVAASYSRNERRKAAKAQAESKRAAEEGRRSRRPNPKDPFGDDGDNTQIIYTEAFTAITDEMLEEADRKKREALEEKMEWAKAPSPKVRRVKNQVEKNLADEIDTEAVNRAIRETQAGLNTQSGNKEAQAPDMDRRRSETQDIAAELASIRRRFAQEDRNSKHKGN